MIQTNIKIKDMLLELNKKLNRRTGIVIICVQHKETLTHHSRFKLGHLEPCTTYLNIQKLTLNPVTMFTYTLLPIFTTHSFHFSYITE